LAGERNHKYVFFLLEVFNNIIQYQSEGNYNLLYAMLRSDKAFRNLLQIQLPQLPNVSPKAEDDGTISKTEPEKKTAEHPNWLTAEWLNQWKQLLPLSVSLRLLDALSPQIQTLITGSATDEAQIISYLQNNTLVGLLPVPHPIVIRKFNQSEAINIWYTTFIWGVIYLRNTNPPIFYGNDVKLFIVNTTNS